MAQASLAGIPLRLKILRTPEEQAEGFMFKPEPENGCGLLFVYNAPRPLSFWMRNVPYDLDLIALDRALCVRKVYTLRANEERAVEIDGGGQYALEMRSGWCHAHGILIGDKLKVEEE